MAKAPLTGGQWRAWYARFCHLIDRYHDHKDDAGRLARRLQREMASLWVFLCEHGVEPTNNRGEVQSVDQKPSLQLGGLVLRWKGEIP
jgi:transposase